MKKIQFLAIILATVVLTSCGGGGLEADARKIGKMACELKKLKADSTKQAEFDKKNKEYEDMVAKMEEKYKDMKDDKAMGEKAMKIMEEEINKCK